MKRAENIYILNGKHQAFAHTWWLFSMGIFCLFLFTSITESKSQINSKLKAGNQSYKKEKYNDAEKSYSEALNINPDSYISNFNLGDAMYQQKKYKEAVGYFQRSTDLGKNKSEKEQGYYNLGNSYLKQEEIEESINAYKNALKLNPDDLHAKFNLSYAIEKRRKKEEQQKNNQSSQNKNQQKENDKKQQSKPDNSNKQDQQQTAQNKPGKDKNEITDAEAEQIMDALKNNEQKIRQRMYDRNRPKDRGKNDKPW